MAKKISKSADTFDKMSFIEKLPKTGTNVSCIGLQSLKVYFTCGCYFVQHGYCGKPKVPETNIIKYSRVDADRRFFVVICKTHLT